MVVLFLVFKEISMVAVSIYIPTNSARGFPFFHIHVAQLVKNLPAVQEIWVQSLGWEDPLEKGMATHASILAWIIPWTVWSMGMQRVGHD